MDFPIDFQMDFGCIECVASIFLFKVISNLKFYKHCFIKDGLQKNFFTIGWFLVHQRKPQARPKGFNNLQPRQKPTTVTRRLKKSGDFRQDICDFHLSTHIYSKMYMHLLLKYCCKLQSHAWRVGGSAKTVCSFDTRFSYGDSKIT